MGLYVAICLLAALSLVTVQDLSEPRHVVGLIWGTTLGLAVAHWFAFRLSARLVAAGKVRSTDAAIAAAQLIGALTVAVLASIPVVLFDAPAELDTARWVLAGYIGLVGYRVARVGGASVGRALIYGSTTLVAAGVIVLVKNFLVGH